MSDIAEEYRTILTAAGWFDLSSRGRIAIAGPDAQSFLQALVSNDIEAVQPGHGIYATYLTPQGRMIADLEIYHRGASFLAEVPSGAGSSLARRLDEVIFTEDVTIADVTGTTCEIAVVGRAAAELVASALGTDVGQIAGLAELAQADRASAFVVRSGEATLPMFKIVAPAAERNMLLSRLGPESALSEALVEFLRIDAGRPAFGIDMTEETIPLEAGLLARGISTTKGCYVGQEIVIRILHRGGGRVAKRLVKLTMPSSAALPDRGSVLAIDGRDVGKVTSAARSPVDGAVVALGYLQRDVAETGQTVTVGSSSTAVVSSVVA